MSEENIQIFCRLLPITDEAVKYEIVLEDDTEYEKIDFFMPKQQVNPFNEALDEQETFKFNKVFDQDIDQIDVFEMVAKEILDHGINGYNGTIFAYGQTGTGKTHTIVGKDRLPTENIDEFSGIIPRSLQYLFSALNEMEIEATILLSYMEIYRGNAYDLMSKVRKIKDDKDVASSFDELQKVVSRTGPKNKLVLVNLKLVEVKSLQEALKTFVWGSRNRQMAETSINDASSRSHCIFTVHIQYRVRNRLLHSKINFVDLAGSERVGKHHDMSRKLLLEARTINLSLHHLQEVIVALGKSRNNRSNLDRHFHVPYRNTMITNVLRESLGGNCKTSMIATVTPDSDNFNETLSTCKFSQRVAKIKTSAKVNTDIDLRIVVSQLREENSRLLEQLNNPIKDTILNSNNPLTVEEKDKIQKLTIEYLQDEDKFSDLKIDNDMRMIQYCFKLIKFGVNFESNEINKTQNVKTKPKTKKEKHKEEALRQEELRKEEEMKRKALEQAKLKNIEIKNSENNELTQKHTEDGGKKGADINTENKIKKEIANKKGQKTKKENNKTKPQDVDKSATNEPDKAVTQTKISADDTPNTNDVDNSNGVAITQEEPPPLSKKEKARLEKENKKRQQLEKKQELARQKELKKQNKKTKKSKNGDENNTTEANVKE